MQLEKDTGKSEEPLNIYEELFSKKNVEQPIEENLEKETSPEVQGVKPIVQEIAPSFTDKKQTFLDKIKEKSIKMNMKYLVTGLLVGIIANISIYHYQTMELQNNSQKLVTGLLYNLSENNNLEQIASNIYLGMKENGWEPTVKMSNGNIFVFELDKGAEFTITKSEDLISTKFHVQVSNFSNAMVKALLIQLEPSKIGGTKNFINNKKFDPKTNTISFDLDKIGAGMLPNFNNPIYLPPLPTPVIPNAMPAPKVPALDPQIISIPVSPDLDKSINKDNKNSNIDKGIILNKDIAQQPNLKVDSQNVKKDENGKK